LELDQSAEKYIERYNGFPAKASSLDEDAMHGTPGLGKLNFGDNVSINIGAVFGRSIHEDPQVPNYGEPGRELRLKTGMTV
jgi:methionine aminopeptidase